MNRLITILFLFPLFAHAQNNEIKKGNEHYRKGDYEKAETEYATALGKDKNNYKAAFNQGNAQYRLKNFKQAAETYTAAAGNTTDNTEKARALYNKGTTLLKQENFTAAVAAFKEALKLNPNDTDCRYNLVKAMQNLKKTPPPPQNNNQNKPQPQKPPPAPRKNKLTKEQMQQVLNAIRKKERDVQGRLKNEKAPGIMQPDKDW